MNRAFTQSDIKGWTCRHGKVRDVYDLGDNLVIIASDRISAFDWILPTAIPDKGRILTTMSRFWFDFLQVPNHFLSMDLGDLPSEFQQQPLRDRTMLVRKTEVIPYECVVRGYLAGSAWKDYDVAGRLHGLTLPAHLRENEKLPEPIFTPATKAATGHDINISFADLVSGVGTECANFLKKQSLEIYQKAADYARARGVIIADTKFEWGRLPHGEIILIDEVLTPDSSRFWPAASYQPGRPQPSFDKQFVRDWLSSTTWDKNSPPPELPEEIVIKTAEKYREALWHLTGSEP